MTFGCRGGFVEVGQATTEARDRVLLNVRVTMKVDVGQAGTDVTRQPAHGFGESPVYETEVAVRRVLQPPDQGRASSKLGSLLRDAEGLGYRAQGRRGSGSSRAGRSLRRGERAGQGDKRG